MTIDEFNATRFGPGMIAVYREGAHPILAASFDEALLSLDVDGPDEPIWVRCENVEIVPRSPP